MNKQMYKTGRGLIFIFFLMAAVWVFAKYGPGIPINQIVTQKQSFFTVSGEGKVSVVPDLAILTTGVYTQGPTVRQAQEQANQLINQVGSQLKSLGIDEKDLKTSNYNLYPEYDYSSSYNKITGYRVNIDMTVKVRDLDKLNTVVDAVTAAGANQVSGIRLTVDDDKQKELLREAQDKAVTEAKEKAESLAKAAGVSLGKIINIQESGGSLPQAYPMMAKADAAEGRGGTNIEPGTTEITTQITLYYEVR